MKYGESTFDILYLLFAIISGCILLCRAKNRTGKLMGAAALVLGCGDAFHLVPRVLNYFVSSDFTAALGIGKLITSITMTVFYLLLYVIWQALHPGREQRGMTILVWVLTALRIVLCLFPQNGWLTNSSGVTWGVLSFLFYLPVAVGAGLVPILGMLMLPKTVCYILMIIAFLRFGAKSDPEISPSPTEK